MRDLKTEEEIIDGWKGDVTKPLVCISCVTYNHESYIRDAIEGFLIQRTTFPFKIFILDDASTDRNVEIIREYESKYPKLFNCFYLKENTYGKPIRREIIKPFLEARNEGKYIALCEGDDYWTDPYKLQKQVDFMEGHPECVICFTDFEVHKQGTLPYSYISSDQKEISNIEDLMVENFIPTTTVMFRNNLINEFPYWFYNLGIGDWPLFVLLAQYGDIGFIKNKTSIYRVHSGGIWSNGNSIRCLEIGLQAREVIDSHFNYKYHKLLGKKIFKYYYAFINECFVQKDFQKAKEYYLKSLKYIWYISPDKLINYIKLSVLVWFPWVYPFYLSLKAIFTQL